MVAAIQNLDRVVQLYINNHRRRKRSELQTFERQRSIETVIPQAAMGIMADGRRHDHLHRIPERKMGECSTRLLLAREEIEQVDRFESLLELVTTYAGKGLRDKYKGLGDVYIYDVSLWIGAFLRIRPVRVYLHAGSRQGAVALGIADARVVRSVPTSRVPPPLNTLEPYEIEDALCIYRLDFADDAEVPREPTEDEFSAALREALDGGSGNSDD